MNWLSEAELIDMRDRLVIDCDGEPRPLRQALDPWQRADLDALTPGWLRAMGLRREGGLNRSYLERPRGHSKTSDLALLVAAAIALSPRPIRAVGAAADADQAALLRQAIKRLVELNPRLDAGRTFLLEDGKTKVKGLLEVQERRVVNTRSGSTLELLTSDAASTYGLLNVDLFVLDELTHWKSEEFFTALYSAAAKRKHAQLIVISNAGFGMGHSWHWRVREVARTDPAWYFSRLDGPQASWITPDRLEEQRRMLPELAYRRLWLNQWTTGQGDALNQDDVTAAVALPGPLAAPEQGWTYFGGLDLGVSRDRSAFVVIGLHSGALEAQPPDEPARSPTTRAMLELGLLRPREAPVPEFIERPGTNKLKLARCVAWRPPGGGEKLDLALVEQAILALHRLFNLQAVCFDPYQAIYLSQILARAGVPMREVAFTGSALQEMASALVDRFAGGTLALYPDDDLLAELRRLRIVEKSYGLRLDSQRGKDGHGDRATSLALSVLAAKRFGRRPLQLANGGAPLILYPGPDDLRDLEQDQPWFER